MSYRDVRDQQMLASLGPELTRFAAHYVAGQPSLIMLPGGMASALSQATTDFATHPTPPYDYDLEWVSLRTFTDGALKLGLQNDLDADGRMTMASGTVGLFDVTPYSGFVDWCGQQGFNYLIVPWDWRRPPDEAARYLAAIVLPAVRQHVQVAHQVDFLDAGFYLVSHSFGGLVVKSFLDAGGPWVAAVKRAITVAAPFYGYGSSQHFYFAGFEYLNIVYGAKRMAALIGSMPGPYCLMYLDTATYAAVAGTLADDGAYSLTGYPSVDANSPDLDVDPFHPGPNRYPDGWFSMASLAAAAQLRAGLAKPLPGAVLPKLFNIRGVQTQNGATWLNTASGQSWRTIGPGFDPDSDPDPITSTLGAGDDTIPAWSGRLVGTPPDQIVTIADDSITHMTMLDNHLVLDALQHLIVQQRSSHLELAARRMQFVQLWDDAASPAELRAALRTTAPLARPVRPLAKPAGPLAAVVPPATTLAALPRAEQNRLARRFFADLLKAPGHGGNEPPRRP